MNELWHRPLLDTFDLDDDFERIWRQIAYDRRGPEALRYSPEAYMIESIELDDEKIRLWDVDPGPSDVAPPYSEYTFAVPFSGEQRLWMMRPAFDARSVVGEVVRDEVHLYYIATSEAEAWRLLDADLVILREMLDVQRARIGAFNLLLCQGEDQILALIRNYDVSEPPAGWEAPGGLKCWEQVRPH